jgi:hypothetical protein
MKNFKLNSSHSICYRCIFDLRGKHVGPRVLLKTRVLGFNTMVSTSELIQHCWPASYPGSLVIKSVLSSGWTRRAGFLGEVPARLKAHPELRTLLITKEPGYEADCWLCSVSVVWCWFDLKFHPTRCWSNVQKQQCWVLTVSIQNCYYSYCI